MKTSRFVILSAVTAILVGASSTFAAPCESVESAGASTAYQKVDAMLNEQAVGARLQAIGLSSQQAQARLSQLSEQRLGQLAAQADLIQAGGTIQKDKDNHGAVDCVWHQIGVFFFNVYRLVFCWGDLK
jgi:hypothetical protein